MEKTVVMKTAVILSSEGISFDFSNLLFFMSFSSSI